MMGRVPACTAPGQPGAKEKDMLWNIAIVLLILWLLGVVGFDAIGGYINILLVLAVVVILLNLFQGRRAVL
jgi:hypothetical protein